MCQDVVAVSEAMRHVLDLALRAGLTEAKVLITGESGVGKDLVARRIHAASARALRPFVAVNCGGIAETLLESELFGHVRGSFTGAYRDRAGKLQIAHQGTVLLDEIGEMSLRMQALLLRFLENGEVQPVGSDAPASKVDVRVIAATNRDLPALVAAGQFREDLLYRLRVLHIVVPPLRDRREDIRPLVACFLRHASPDASCSEEALQAFEQYRWPGNIRELQNIVEHVLWVAHAPMIMLEDLPASIRPSQQLVAQRERRRHVSDDLLQQLVESGRSFWDHVHPLFLGRDITRNDIRELVERALHATGGSYRAVVRLFNMPDADYRRFLAFLAAHDCQVDFRPYRAGLDVRGSRRPMRMPPSVAADRCDARSWAG